MIRPALFIACLAAVALSQDEDSEAKEPRYPFHYQPLGLSGGVAENIEDVLGRDIDDSFTCQGRSQGFYADEANDCLIFYFCKVFTEYFSIQGGEDDFREFDPSFSFVAGEDGIATVEERDGQQVIAYEQRLKYTFGCGNQTRWSQLHLGCLHPQFAVPCQGSNDRFGVRNNVILEEGTPSQDAA